VSTLLRPFTMRPDSLAKYGALQIVLCHMLR